MGGDDIKVGEIVKKTNSLRAEITQSTLITTAARLLREKGPEGVTYRSVGAAAGLSGSVTGYYFDSIAELLALAGEHNIVRWARRAEDAAAEAESLAPDECRQRVIELLMVACLPHDHSTLTSHYQQLLAAANSRDVTGAYRRGRERLDRAIAKILAGAGYDLPTFVVASVIDGAVVAALSEGRDPAESVTRALEQTLHLCDAAGRRSSPPLP